MAENDNLVKLPDALERQALKIEAAMIKIAKAGGQKSFNRDDGIAMSIMSQDLILLRTILELFPSPVPIQTIYKRWKELRQ